MSYAFDWIDAFTDKVFGGNGCVVVHGADALSLEDRMALVRETSLSECAYVVASDKADFGARYYLAGQEILMAGHPTVATVVSLVKRGLIDLSGGRAETNEKRTVVSHQYILNDSSIGYAYSHIGCRGVYRLAKAILPFFLLVFLFQR